MLLEKPDWVSHGSSSGGKCGIYGIDLHPDGTRFATAGGDNLVKIWGMMALLEPEEENQKSVKLWATLSWHQNSVNCIRWSNSGRYLASGSDDHMVMLYELVSGKPAAVPFGSNAAPNVENWVRISTLNRHTMNVEDVAWSPDDCMLATCSIDNKILIWSVNPARISSIATEPLRTLTGHTSWVKGLAWDPVGKFLASSGEDKTLIVWRVSDWQIEKRISEPYDKCVSSSYFRRISWSPDGASICTTNGYKSKIDVAPLIDRGTWSNEVDLVGHRGVVTCARFNSRLLTKSQGSSKKEFACVAIGGEDNTISIWLAQVSRPLAIIKDCFEGSVTDMSWSRNGDVLLSSSLDGTVCFFKFEGTEIGYPITDEDQSRLLLTKFGSRAGTTLISDIAENPSQYQYENSSTPNVVKPRKKVSILQDSTSTNNTTTTTTAIAMENLRNSPQKQVETKSKSGKRRIAPVLLGGSATTSTSTITTAEASKTVLQSSSSISESNNGASSPLSLKISGKTTIAALSSEKDDVTVPISSPQKSTPVKSNEKSPASKSDVAAEESKEMQHLPSPAKTSAAEPLTPVRQSSTSSKRMRLESSELSSSSPLLQSLSSISTTRYNNNNNIESSPKRENRKGYIRKSYCVDPNPVRLQVWHEIKPRDGLNGPEPPLLLEGSVKNVKVDDDAAVDGEPGQVSLIESGPVYTTVSCSKSGVVSWSDRFPGRVTGITGNEWLAAVSVTGGSLYVLRSLSGRRLLPCIVLGRDISILECAPRTSPFLLAITTAGIVKLWNVKSQKIIVSDNLETILTGSKHNGRLVHTKLIRARVTSAGQPILTFSYTEEKKSISYLKSYTYHFDMECWMRVADDCFVASDFKTFLPPDEEEKYPTPTNGILAKLQSASAMSRSTNSMSASLLAEMTSAVQQSVTKAHLENEMASSALLRSPIELKCYVRYLSKDSDSVRMRELFTDLLGPPSASTKKSKSAEQDWDPYVLGISKRRLLSEVVLPLAGKNRSLQRLVAEFQSMLEKIKN